MKFQNILSFQGGCCVASDFYLTAFYEKINESMTKIAHLTSILTQMELQMNSPGHPKSERRRHERHPLISQLAAGPLLSLKTEGGVLLPVLNWSYGGLKIAVTGVGHSALGRLDGPEAMHGTLKMAVASELSQSVEFKVISATENTVSCAFVHDSPDALLFMRPWMECLRRGSGMTELASNAIKPELAAAGWKIWRGEGPLTLSARHSEPRHSERSEESSLQPRHSERSEESSLPDWQLVFPLGEGYAEVGSTDGKLYSRKSVDNDGMASTRMQAPNAKDVGLLNLTLMYLAGCAAGGVPETLCAKIIDQLRRDA
jgi:hypothetical protein